MGERKGQNKYYPPDFDYKVHKSLSGYHGQHALRERARKLDQGILIIRFEMPYNIWCDGCKNHIGMGVRYNAEKSKIGNYYSTPIFKFRMKCHLCSNHFEIKTDPANHDYVIITGAQRKEQRWDPHENEQIVPEDRDNQKKLVLDSMYKLEHSSNDQSKIKAAAPRLAQILEQQSVLKDDFALNQLARKQFRDAKKAIQSSQAKDDQLKKRLGLTMNLLPEDEKDVSAAKLLRLSSFQNREVMQKKKQESMKNHLLFGSDNPGKDLSAKSVSARTIQSIFSSENNRKRSEAFSLDVNIKQINNALSESDKILGPDVQPATEKETSGVKPSSNNNALSLLMSSYAASSTNSGTESE